ncbi:MAG TPA: GNAT family N-acetyltransferase [Schlesneria sp.]|jgi:hypothetical protein
MPTSQFKVLDRNKAAERTEWLALWNAWPEREVFAHPDYPALFAKPGDQILCAVEVTTSGGVLFPFLLRPLAREEWVEDDNQSWDLVGPYGYGGVFAWGVDEDAENDFWVNFETWIERQNVVSSFVRLSLFPDQTIPFRGIVELNTSNIVRNLDIEPDALWREYEHKVRKNVNKAKQANLTVEIDSSGQRLEEFLAIYYSTMDRRDASGTYYFPKSFFESLCTNLSGQYLFFHVLHESKMISTELVLVSQQHLYSFLGGTLPDGFSMCPNDLLKHEVNLWGRTAEKHSFVLGGGYNGEDGIFRYKKSFAPQGVTSFFVGKQIHQPAVYDRLVSQRQQWEESRGVTWTPKPGYFPLYRA